MAITPNTEVYLIRCPLEIDNLNQLTFNRHLSQENYFKSLINIHLENFTYQRKDNVIRYPAHIDSIMDYNYVMYKNDYYNDKWIYAYVTKMEYVNDHMTNIYIKTDVFQTWQFDIEFKKSFVEREHVNNDSIGHNLIDEGLELGEFVNNGTPVEDNTLKEMIVVLAVTTGPNGETIEGVTPKGSIVDGLHYTAYAVNGAQKELAITGLKNRIQQYASNGYLDNIVTLFSAPSSVWLGYNHDTSITSALNELLTVETDLSINRNNSLNGYTPVNKKLLTAPFNYLLVDNNSGNATTYSYELFGTPATPTFKVRTTPSIEGGSMLIPYNYKGISTYNYNEVLNGGKFATCSYTGDTYINWLAQNRLTNGFNSVGALGNIVLGIGGIKQIANPSLAVTGASMLGSGLNTIFDMIQQRHQAQFMPPQIGGNVANGDLNSVFAHNTYTLYNMSIKSDRAKIIDNFFSMYGYKVTDLKVPNITGRRNWNYVKTIGVNIEGNVPQEDIQEIKDIFNNGVTLWHNSSTFLDYSQNNDIILI